MHEKFHAFKKNILRLSDLLETAIALFLILIAAALTVKFIYAVMLEGPGNWGQETIHGILQDAFNLIIAVEFIRMLLKHSIGSILEIVLFSVARGLVVEHASAPEVVLTVLALGLVLFIRKFFLLPHDLEESISEAEEMREKEAGIQKME